MIKRSIAISLLFIFVFSTTDVGQLLKFPVLFHHFMEHEKTEKSISFTSFLIEHYSNSNNHPDNSKHDHQNLPFKTCSCHAVNTVLAFGAQPIFIEENLNIISTDNVLPVYHQNYLSTVFGSIWQPPKLG